jgi:hypothetical protein
VPDGYQDHDRIATFRSGRGINSSRDIDVKAGLIRYLMLLEDAIEAVFIVLREKDIVGAEFRELSVECPIEGYA